MARSRGPYSRARRQRRRPCRTASLERSRCRWRSAWRGTREWRLGARDWFLEGLHFSWFWGASKLESAAMLDDKSSRREFLGASSASVAGSLAALAVPRNVHAAGTGELK